MPPGSSPSWVFQECAIFGETHMLKATVTWEATFDVVTIYFISVSSIWQRCLTKPLMFLLFSLRGTERRRRLGSFCAWLTWPKVEAHMRWVNCLHARGRDFLRSLLAPTIYHQVRLREPRQRLFTKTSRPMIDGFPLACRERDHLISMKSVCTQAELLEVVNVFARFLDVHFVHEKPNSMKVISNQHPCVPPKVQTAEGHFVCRETKVDDQVLIREERRTTSASLAEHQENFGPTHFD